MHCQREEPYREESFMPVISIELGSVSPEVRAELISRLTSTASEVTQIPSEKFVVFVKEYPRDAIGVGGTQLSKIP